MIDWNDIIARLAGVFAVLALAGIATMTFAVAWQLMLAGGCK